MASGRGAGAHAADERVERDAVVCGVDGAPGVCAAEDGGGDSSGGVGEGARPSYRRGFESAGRIRRLDEKRFERLEETGLDVLSRELKNQSKNIIIPVIRDIFLFFYDDHVTNEREKEREREREIEVHSLVFIFNTPSKYYFTFCYILYQHPVFSANESLC